MSHGWAISACCNWCCNSAFSYMVGFASIWPPSHIGPMSSWPFKPILESKILECRTRKWLHLGHYYCYHYTYCYCMIIYLLPSLLFYIYECFYGTCEILSLAYPGHQCNVLNDKDLTTNSQSKVILRRMLYTWEKDLASSEEGKMDSGWKFTRYTDMFVKSNWSFRLLLPSYILVKEK